MFYIAFIQGSTFLLWKIRILLLMLVVFHYQKAYYSFGMNIIQHMANAFSWQSLCLNVDKNEKRRYREKYYRFNNDRYTRKSDIWNATEARSSPEDQFVNVTHNYVTKIFRRQYVCCAAAQYSQQPLRTIFFVGASYDYYHLGTQPSSLFWWVFLSLSLETA